MFTPDFAADLMLLSLVLFAASLLFGLFGLGVWIWQRLTTPGDTRPNHSLRH